MKKKKLKKQCTKATILLNQVRLMIRDCQLTEAADVPAHVKVNEKLNTYEAIVLLMQGVEI